MLEVTQQIEDAIAGHTPLVVCNTLIKVCAGRFALEKDAKEARLWGAMTTGLKRVKGRWEKGCGKRGGQ